MVTLNLGSNLLPVRPYSGAGLRGAPDKNPATFPREDGSMKKCAVAVTGARGEGKDTGVPAIGGQHYRYLLARPRNFSYGHRGAGNLQLLESMGGITPPADENVANYVSRLSYLTAEDSPP